MYESKSSANQMHVEIKGIRIEKKAQELVHTCSPHSLHSLLSSHLFCDKLMLLT